MTYMQFRFVERGSVKGRDRTLKGNGIRSGRAERFSLIELLVVMAIISILAAILFPALSKAKESANSITCKSNLRQQTQAYLIYGSDYSDYNVPVPYIDNECWFSKISVYFGKPIGNTRDAATVAKLPGTVFDCPAAPGPKYSPATSLDNYYLYNYGINTTPSVLFAIRAGLGSAVFANGNYYKFPYKLTRIKKTSETVLIADSIGGVTPTAMAPNSNIAYMYYAFTNDLSITGLPTIGWNRHGRSCNWSYFDGHVDNMNLSEFWKDCFDQWGGHFGKGWVE